MQKHETKYDVHTDVDQSDTTDKGIRTRRKAKADDFKASALNALEADDLQSWIDAKLQDPDINEYEKGVIAINARISRYELLMLLQLMLDKGQRPNLTNKQSNALSLHGKMQELIADAYNARK